MIEKHTVVVLDMAQNLGPISWKRFFFTYLLVQNMSRKLGPNSWKVFSTNTLRKAEDLMPRDIMSSEPRHWMVFGQLAMPVQCCAEARRRRVPQHSTAQAWPTGQMQSSALAQMTECLKPSATADVSSTKHFRSWFHICWRVLKY